MKTHRRRLVSTVLGGFIGAVLALALWRLIEWAYEFPQAVYQISGSAIGDGLLQLLLGVYILSVQPLLMLEISGATLSYSGRWGRIAPELTRSGLAAYIALYFCVGALIGYLVSQTRKNEKGEVRK